MTVTTLYDYQPVLLFLPILNRQAATSTVSVHVFTRLSQLVSKTCRRKSMSCMDHSMPSSLPDSCMRRSTYRTHLFQKNGPYCNLGHNHPAQETAVTQPFRSWQEPPDRPPRLPIQYFAHFYSDRAGVPASKRVPKLQLLRGFFTFHARYADQ